MTSSTQSPSSDAAKPTVAELQADIETQREQLAQTVDALSAKLDVKSRTRASVSAAKGRATEQVATARRAAADLARKGTSTATTDEGGPTPTAIGAAAGAAVAVATLVVLSLMRRRRR